MSALGGLDQQTGAIRPKDKGRKSLNSHARCLKVLDTRRLIVAPGPGRELQGPARSSLSPLLAMNREPSLPQNRPFGRRGRTYVEGHDSDVTRVELQRMGPCGGSDRRECC